MKQYSRVSYEVRCQISALLQAEITIPEIARQLGFHKSTVYREIKRNSHLCFGKKVYYANVANKFARQRFKSCRKRPAVKEGLESLVIEKLWRSWSPEQIAGRLNLERGIKLSHESIYRFLKKNPEHRIHLKFAGKRGQGRYRQRRNRPKWYRNIRERSPVIEQRKRIGDWERDCMYLSNKKQVLVCTDRKTKYTKLAKLERATSLIVAGETKKLLESTGKKVFSITNDNGSEFRGYVKMKAPVFFCDPLKPQQRGTVENQIGDLRRYMTHDTDINSVNIDLIEDLINKKPRKCLGYRTPYEVFFNKKVALAL